MHFNIPYKVLSAVTSSKQLHKKAENKELFSFLHEAQTG